MTLQASSGEGQQLGEESVVEIAMFRALIGKTAYHIRYFPLQPQAVLRLESGSGNYCISGGSVQV